MIATLLWHPPVQGQDWSAPPVLEFRVAAAHSDKATLKRIVLRVEPKSDALERWIGILGSAVLAQRSGQPSLSAVLLDSLVHGCPGEMRLIHAIARKHQSAIGTDLGNYTGAMRSADQGLALLDLEVDRELASELLTVKAEAQIELEDYSGALSLLDSAFKLGAKGQHPRGMAMALLNMGNIQFRQKRYSDAFVRYQQAIRAIAADPQDVIAIRSASNMAAAAVMNKDHDGALRMLDSMISGLGDREPLIRSRCWASKSYVSNMREDYTSALLQIRMAGSIADSNHLTEDRAKLKQQRANILWRSGAKKQALDLNIEALRIADSTDDRTMACELHKKLSRWFKELADPRSALFHQEAYNRINDSLNAARFDDRLAYGEVLFETERKEHTIKEQEQALLLAQAEDRKKSFQRNVSIGIAALLLLIATLLYRSMRARKRLAEKEKELHGEQVDQLLSQQEIKSINAMLEGQEKERDRLAKDLHDRLGSMLGGIKAQLGALEDRVEQVQHDAQFQKVNRLLDETVGELRQISHDMAASTLSRFGLEKALKDLRDTIHISGRLSVEMNAFGLEQRLERSVEIAVYRIVQELVSNVLKHAKARELSIDVTRSPGRISVIVSDNGVGFDITSPAEGMGLGNVRSRAAALGGKVQVDSSPGKGTTVSVECPVVE